MRPCGRRAVSRAGEEDDRSCKYGYPPVLAAHLSPVSSPSSGCPRAGRLADVFAFALQRQPAVKWPATRRPYTYPAPIRPRSDCLLARSRQSDEQPPVVVEISFFRYWGDGGFGGEPSHEDVAA